MNTPKHTPGPWTLERDRAKSLSLYSGSVFIGEVYHEVDEPSTQEQANAHLIAAAPAMYLELQNIVEGLTDEITRIIEGNEPDTAWLDYLANKAGQATAQAEGRG